ncbi:Juvenile hormone diol kinase [Operophtera brumata]|uniref:Juvenile hormone diol kinase n=1 Tax=Operophtera brumata TaxID=104452 RepID=A0A0L7LEJ6_OPEBR|nr:Juvenile hormone diol kinase [Operophtera brumata]
MSLSEFRRKKLLYVFNVFFDVNQSGTIERKDFELAIEVSVEEWNSMWNDYAQNPSAALKWQQQYCHFMFQLEDASADGSIDCDEFTTGKSSVGWEEFQELWKEYFSTEDPTAAGNFIFGRTSF